MTAAPITSAGRFSPLGPLGILQFSYRTHIGKGAAVLEVPMDYILEAIKFIQRARDGSNPDVIKTDLEMAEWCLSQAIKEQDESDSRGPRNSN
jgi:hypothetical protein